MKTDGEKLEDRVKSLEDWRTAIEQQLAPAATEPPNTSPHFESLMQLQAARIKATRKQP